jgi:hypothetical protein
MSYKGFTILGEITEDTGFDAVPIKFSTGFQDKLENFVPYVAQNYSENNIKQGKISANGIKTYLISIEDTHNNTLYIELSKEGSYWNVNSASIFRKDYAKNEKDADAKTEPMQTDATQSVESSLPEIDKGNSPSEPNGETQHPSDSKGINKFSEN